MPTSHAPHAPHPPEAARVARERKTLRAMFRIFCRAHGHAGPGGLCDACSDLLAYAEKRLLHCPYGADKPVCSRCPVHCYKPAMRTRVQDVMRFSGPRMLRRHPILAILHLFDRRREVSPLGNSNGKPSTDR